MQEFFSHLTAAALTDQGRKRKNNEDAHGVFVRNGVFCVADGMGGAAEGEFASRTVVDAVTAALANCLRYERPLGREAMLNCMSAAVNRASDYLYQRSLELGLGRTGTTFVGVCFDVESPNGAFAIHAGDSRLYRIRGAEVMQITRDHSAAALAGVDEKELNPRFRGVVVRSVGDCATADLEITPLDVAEGDLLLLCSDGLTRMVADEEIGRILSQSSDVQTQARLLVEAANAAGGADNITVVVVSVGVLPAPVAALSAAEYVELETRAVSANEAGGERNTGEASDRTSACHSYGGSSTTSPGRERMLFSEDSVESLEAVPKSTPHMLSATENDLQEAPGLTENKKHNPSVPTAAVAEPSTAKPEPVPKAGEAAEVPKQERRKARDTGDATPGATKRGTRMGLSLTGAAALLLCGGVLIAQLRRMEADKQQALISAHTQRAAVQTPVPPLTTPTAPATVSEVVIPPSPAIPTPQDSKKPSPQVDAVKLPEKTRAVERAESVPPVAKEPVTPPVVKEDKPAVVTRDEKTAAAVVITPQPPVVEAPLKPAEREITKPATQVAVVDKPADTTKPPPDPVPPTRPVVQQTKPPESASSTISSPPVPAPAQKEVVVAKPAAVVPTATKPGTRPAEHKAVAKADPNTRELLALAKDTEVLGRFLFAVSVSDDTNIKTVSQTLRDKAETLSKHSEAELTTPDTQKDVADFVYALANVVAVLPFIADAWYVRIDTYEQKTSRTADAERARQGVDKWSALVQGCSRLGDLSSEQARGRLVELARLTDAVMKQLQAAPGLTHNITD